MAEPDSSVTPDPVPAPASPSVALPLPPQLAALPQAAPPSLAWIDGALVAVVLLLAFLLASLPITNSDFFRQLATGRLVSQGRYPFGTNPFVFSLDGIYWVNHSWLFGLLVYLLYQLPAGGVILVVVKALAVALVAELMLRSARRPGQSLWLPAVCTALAVVTLSPYLSLSPRCASYLGLALVAWLLTRARQQPRAAWLIPPLCLLWVNLDGWFWLGPLLVALHLVAELFEQPAGPQRVEACRRWLAVLGASLAVCLVNPYFPYSWRVFELPAELSPGTYLSSLREEELFRSFFLSPWNREYFSPHAGLSVAGLAYFVLVTAGAASFVLDARKLSLGRVLPWLVFALLSLWNSRLIPFFAIVAGPITAQGFLSWTEGLPRWTPPWRAWALAGRGLSLLVGLLLLVATVPGWLQAQPHRRHRVGWGVDPNPSLEAAARAIQQWHEDGQLPAGENWLCVAPEVGPYLVWYCPGERAWIDDSLLSCPEAAQEYLQIRQALATRSPSGAGEAAGASAEADARWQEFFRARNVHLVLHHFEGRRAGLHELLERSLARPGEWAPCHLEGYAAIFAWHDRQASPSWRERVASLTIKVSRLAFGPEARPAPPRGPEQELAATPWWQELWYAPPSASLDQGTADLHGQRFLALGPALRLQQDLQLQAMIPAGAIGFAAQPGMLNPMTLEDLGWSLAYRDHPLGTQPPWDSLSPVEQMALRFRIFRSQMEDYGPPTSPYLGIRAARRALALDPNDPYTHLLLGQAYYRLGWNTRERFLTRDMPECKDLRIAQATAALNNVLRLQPSLAQEMHAHQLLANLYHVMEQRRLDMETQHRREELRCARALGPLPQEEEDSYDKRLQQLEKMVTQLEAALSRNENLFQVQSARRPLMERVQRALSLGLVETAYQELKRDLDEHADQPPPGEVLNAAQLKLHMGQVQDARDLLEPSMDHPNMQPLKAANPWPYVQLALVQGNYDEADRHLEQRLELLHRDVRAREVSRLVAAALLADAPQAAGMPGQQLQRPLALYGLPSGDLYLQAACRISLEKLQDQAECHFFRGWLALEAGQIERAEEQLRLALEHLVPLERWVPLLKGVVLMRSDEHARLQNLSGRQESVRHITQLYLDWIHPRK